MDTDNDHQFEISVGQFTLPAIAATEELREGQEVDRITVLNLLGGSCGPDPLAVPFTPRLRVAKIRHLFWDDDKRPLHTVNVRLEPSC